MEHYDDYTKEEDYMMWELHEIRKDMAKQSISPEDVNNKARDIIRSMKASKKEQAYND